MADTIGGAAALRQHNRYRTPRRWPGAWLAGVAMIAGLPGTAAMASASPLQSNAEQGKADAPPVATLVASFDGLGRSFVGPQGRYYGRNPSDNSLAVGPNHIVQTVNTRMAIYTKKGAVYGETGRVLYGPVETRNVFRGFGGPCEATNNGDAVVRYDQLADRWLIVMPIFTRQPKRADEPVAPTAADGATLSLPGRPAQPGPAVPLFQPAAMPLEMAAGGRAPERSTSTADGSYAMCYAVSATPDPLGAYYRYEFVRPLFPDYPRPAVWPDGYYVPTSSGDEVIQKQACVAERAKMLAGKPARELCTIIDGVNFLENADIDGTTLPPKGAPNIVIAAGGSQLRGKLGDDALYFWKYHVDWAHPSRTSLTGPTRLAVAPYQYLCGGQLTKCVPQPGTDVRLDSQGDKITQRFTYRRIGDRQSLLATHSIASDAGGGGVRWYEFRLNGQGDPQLYQQGTFAPDAAYRWMPSAAMDRYGNIGIGYSYGDAKTYVGQRFAGRLTDDPHGTLRGESVLVDGQAAQTNTLRWEDYAEAAVDPSDDCTIWYVGDYLGAGDAAYSTRIGAFSLGRCGGHTG